MTPEKVSLYIFAGVGLMVSFVFVVLFLPVLMDFYHGLKAWRIRRQSNG